MAQDARYSFIVIFGGVLSHIKTLDYIRFQDCEVPHKDWHMWLISEQLCILENYHISIRNLRLIYILRVK